MRVAITGSSGLIGTALRAALAARGDQVVRVLRSHAGPNDVLWDIDAGTIDATALEGIDAVVHLAGEGIGEKKWSPEQKKVLVESRTKGTSLIATTIAGLTDRPAVFLSGSAMGFYGNRGTEELSEASAVGSGFLPDLVAAWEDAAQPAINAGIRTAFLRTALVLSADGGALAEQLPFFRLGIGGKAGDGTQCLSWISIDDHVRAMLHIIDSDLSGPVNLSAPNPVTNAEFAKSLGQALRRPTILPTPRLAIYARLGKEAGDALVYESANVVPTALLDSGFKFEHPVIDSAFAALL